jgi:hypothetical protein
LWNEVWDRLRNQPWHWRPTPHPGDPRAEIPVSWNGGEAGRHDRPVPAAANH